MISTYIAGTQAPTHDCVCTIRVQSWMQDSEYAPSNFILPKHTLVEWLFLINRNCRGKIHQTGGCAPANHITLAWFRDQPQTIANDSNFNRKNKWLMNNDVNTFFEAN